MRASGWQWWRWVGNIDGCHAVRADLVPSVHANTGTRQYPSKRERNRPLTMTGFPKDVSIPTSHTLDSVHPAQNAFACTRHDARMNIARVSVSVSAPPSRARHQCKPHTPYPFAVKPTKPRPRYNISRVRFQREGTAGVASQHRVLTTTRHGDQGHGN